MKVMVKSSTHSNLLGLFHDVNPFTPLPVLISLVCLIRSDVTNSQCLTWCRSHHQVPSLQHLLHWHLAGSQRIRSLTKKRAKQQLSHPNPRSNYWRTGVSVRTVGCFDTVRCLYDMVNFLPNPHNAHPIVCLWRWYRGCLLWVWT